MLFRKTPTVNDPQRYVSSTRAHVQLYFHETFAGIGYHWGGLLTYQLTLYSKEGLFILDITLKGTEKVIEVTVRD